MCLRIRSAEQIVPIRKKEVKTSQWHAYMPDIGVACYFCFCDLKSREVPVTEKAGIMPHIFTLDIYDK